ncbi:MULTISPECIES: hypothetical protein [Pseudomonas]|uniref:Lipoprotein n=1 Tax=Pseudomonas folii TaxID=2762593 RepID=A0ABR7B1U5_9PSED|nr:MULTISPECIES: hypothetical protein [Pseudomonas]MBC3951123.1 hypothetical protein [Pseudomonas folii]
MNSFARRIVFLTLGGLMTAGLTSLAQAQTLPNSTLNNGNSNNSPIHRANPNSRQGTVPATPPVRGPSTAPNPRPPTLENGGIGNGYPTRQQAPRPADNNTGQNRKSTD